MTTYEPGTIGWWMDERRGHLRMTWDNVAEVAGVSVETVYRAASGRPMRTPTKKGIEEALRWAPGSVDAILDGGEPTPLDAAEPEPDRARDRDAELVELRAMVGTLIDYAQELQDRVERLTREE